MNVPGCRNGRHLSSMDLSLDEYITSVELAPSTGSDETWRTIMNWWTTSMQDYDERSLKGMDHLISGRYEKKESPKLTFRPTRLLDLQDSSASLTANLRLSISVKTYGKVHT